MSNDRIVPRIKAMHPATGDGAGGIELPAGQEPILVPLAGDVAIAFAIDTGENYQLLHAEI